MFVWLVENGGYHGGGSEVIAVYDNKKSAIDHIECIIENVVDERLGKYEKPKITDDDDDIQYEWTHWFGEYYRCTRHFIKPDFISARDI